jgi:hypothetical protein
MPGEGSGMLGQQGCFTKPRRSGHGDQSDLGRQHQTLQEPFADNLRAEGLGDHVAMMWSWLCQASSVRD